MNFQRQLETLMSSLPNNEGGETQFEIVVDGPDGAEVRLRSLLLVRLHHFFQKGDKIVNSTYTKSTSS